MKNDLSILLVILGCALVTVIPRVLPFAVIRNLNMPQPILKWLSYIPVCLLTALIMQGVIRPTETTPQIDWTNVLIIIPTLLIALRTKSLLFTVIGGIVTAALIRWIA